MKGLDQTAGMDNSIETLREVVLYDVNRIMDKETDKEEESKSFRRDFDVGDLSTDDLEFYMRFRNRELTNYDINQREGRFKKVTGSPSQMQLFHYVVKNFNG